jgi:ribosomal protein S18 acetylase RimI-like enzyme
MDAAARVDARWSRFLGVPMSALQRPGVVVTEHAELREFRGVWFFVRGDSGVVSAPTEWVDPLRRSLASATAEELVAPGFASRVLRHAAGEIVGPSFQGWLSATRFRPVSDDDVRPIPEFDRELIRDFQASCSQQEWEHAGIDPSRGDVRASFQDAQVVALAQLRSHADGAVDPCVITHREHRGRGHALRLVSALAREALSAERLVLYQTLVSNAPAMSLAHRLGFERYATLIAVRLASSRDADDSGRVNA